MVMPRSRSRSMESRTCSCISRCESAPVISRRRSASVDLPWSICAMMQKFRMNFGSIVLAYKMFSLTNFLNCGQDSNRPPGFSGGPAAFERATHAAQKPCRINIQFATIHRPRQPARSFMRNAKLHVEEASASRLHTVAGSDSMRALRVNRRLGSSLEWRAACEQFCFTKNERW